MPIYQVKTELKYPELLALLDYSRKVRSIQREEEVWEALVGTASTFYDNVGLFVPVNDHQLRMAVSFHRDPEIQEKFAALRHQILIDAQRTPLSLVSSCFRTRATTYISEATDEEVAQQNRLVMELMKPTDGLNVPILVGELVRAVLGCINSTSGYDSLANVALVEVLAHLTSNWYEMYERSLGFALQEQMWKDTTLQILHDAFHSLGSAITGTRLLGRAAIDLSETQIGHLDLVENNQLHVKRLLNELADFCRLERGSVPLQLRRYKPERLLKVVEEAIGGLAEGARERVRLHSDIAEPFAVPVDLDRFRQIVANLISNAVKYSGDQITVEVRCRQPTFAVMVADQGPGIALEEQSKIFDPYYRIKNRAPTDPSGWGLGLYITKRLVELHQGELEVQSAPARGSAFTVKLFDAPRAA